MPHSTLCQEHQTCCHSATSVKSQLPMLNKQPKDLWGPTALGCTLEGTCTCCSQPSPYYSGHLTQRFFQGQNNRYYRHTWTHPGVYCCLMLQNLKVDTNRVMMLADGEGLFHSRLGTTQSMICQRGTMAIHGVGWAKMHHKSCARAWHHLAFSSTGPAHAGRLSSRLPTLLV
jgi:hypothetical protein